MVTAALLERVVASIRRMFDDNFATAVVVDEF
jgi:hypothetical protein